MSTKKKPSSSEQLIKSIRRNTRKLYSAEEKIQIVMEGIRGEISIAELCRKYGMNDSSYYKWNKEFLEAGKKRLQGDETREASSDEVKDLRRENRALKESLADLVIRYDIVKKKLGSVGLSSKWKKYMRLTAEEKAEIVLLVSRSDLGVNRTLNQLGIHKRTFYNWYHAYSKGGIDALKAKGRSSMQWNRIADQERNLVVELALEYTDHSPRMLAVKMTDEQGIFISESSVYRILKSRGLIQESEHRFMAAANEFKHKTSRVHEMWQTDFTYFRIIGWGWYYLSTIIDDYSRYIIHYELCKNMACDDVKRNIDQAMLKAKLGKRTPPKLLSDNGGCYIAKDLEQYLDKEHSIRQIHGKPLHPQTQGKIERYHRSMKNVVKLHNYYCPSQLEKAIAEYVDFYNNQRYHESLKNLTPADVYTGRGEQILKIREQIKRDTIRKRRKLYLQDRLLKAH